MNVLVNTGFFSTVNTKQCRYFLYEIFKHITAKHAEINFYFLVTADDENDFLFGKNCFTTVIKLKSETAINKQRWIQFQLPQLLKKIKPQLIVQPFEYFSKNARIQQVLTVCDESAVSKNVINAENIITSSNAISKKIHQTFGLQQEKIKVVHAVPESIFKPQNEIIKKKVKDEFSSACEYFLFADETASEPIFINVLKAFSIFKNKQKSNMKLLVLSNDLLNNKNVTEKIKTYKFRNDVILPDDLKENDIAEIFASAYSVLYLPESNGWNMLLKCAMQSGTAVITSNIHDTDETGEETVLYADAKNFEDIARQMLLLYKDENLRNKLIANSLLHMQLFGWEKSAEQFWQVMLKALAEK